jgi:hypothetical protein
VQVHLNVLYFLLADQQIILCLGWLRLAIVALGAPAPAKGESLRGAIGKCGVYPIFFTVYNMFFLMEKTMIMHDNFIGIVGAPF